MRAGCVASNSAASVGLRANRVERVRCYDTILFGRRSAPGACFSTSLAVSVSASGYEHYVKQGRAEGCRKGMPMRWIEETYLAANPDVAAEVKAGKYDSDEEHCMKVGSLENREISLGLPSFR